MFDTLYCQYPLPNPEVQANAFQTKSLDSLMERYTLTRVGRLVRHVEVFERRSTSETRWGFVLEVVDTWDEDTHYHGDIEFYSDQGGVYYTYWARLVGGQLHRLGRADEEAPAHSPGRSAKTARYAQIFKDAVRVFAGTEPARGWLWLPNAELGGKTPLELVETREGFEQVLALLTGLAHAKERL